MNGPSEFFQQLENIPITGVYSYTAPDTTRDCENDPNYDRDQVQPWQDNLSSPKVALKCKKVCVFFRWTQNFSTKSSRTSLAASFPSLEG